MSEWQLQLEFENGEEFGFFLYVKGDRTFKSLRNNEGKHSTKVGAHLVSCSAFDNPCRGGWFRLQISRLLSA